VKAARYLYALIVVSTTVLAGCGSSPGQPQKGSETLTPAEVLDVGALYGENCAACHGADGRGGAAIALANPVYLAIADETAMRAAVANGVRGTSMPAFAQAAGGMLTSQQVDALVGGIRSRWSRPRVLDGANPPSYAAASAGDAQRGDAQRGDAQRGGVAYGTYCESCHGQGGSGGPKGSAITNDAFLALVSDQGLRTIVITGRPELGAPDWRGNTPGRAMSAQEVTDVVAWLASRRVASPGQPYAASNPSPQ
jgi:mono/diheme cytochrome c family protein